MSSQFLLDTNAVSDLIRKTSPMLLQAWSNAVQRKDAVAISALTHAELLFGFRQNPSAVRVQASYKTFLVGTDTLPWTDEASASYAYLRLHLKTHRLVVDTIDLLIASQAHALGATLVTRDKAFRHVSDLVNIVNWATDLQ